MYGVKSKPRKTLHTVVANMKGRQRRDNVYVTVFAFSLPSDSVIAEVVCSDPSHPSYPVDVEFNIGNDKVELSGLMVNSLHSVDLSVWDGGIVLCTIIGGTPRHLIVYYER